MKKIFQLLGFASVVALILGAVGVFDLTVVNDVLATIGLNVGGGVLAVAGAGVVVEGGTPTTETAAEKSPDLLVENISQVITKISPADAPLDTILRSLSRDVKIGGWETKYYAVDTRGIEDTVQSELTFTSAQTRDLAVGNIHIWSVDDLVLVNGVMGNDDDDLVLHVVDKNTSNNTLKVIALNGVGAAGTGEGFYVPPIAASKVLTRIGNAKAEMDVQTSPYAIYPTPTKNWCQIHMAQVEESVYEKMHNKEVKWDITDFYTQAIFDMRRSMELTSLFNYAPANQPVFDPIGNDKKYFSRGITRFINKADTYNATTGIATTDLVRWTKNIFTGNSGSDERVFFAGKNLIESLSNIETSKQVSAKETEVKWGMRFNVIETNFGKLMVKHHRLFDSAGWAANGLVLDVNNIERHVFKGFEDLELDLIKSGQKNAYANVISEAFCLAVRYPDTHMIIKPS